MSIEFKSAHDSGLSNEALHRALAQFEVLLTGYEERDTDAVMVVSVLRLFAAQKLMPVAAYGLIWALFHSEALCEFIDSELELYPQNPLCLALTGYVDLLDRGFLLEYLNELVMAVCWASDPHREIH